jgi:hypothetical protein
LYGAATSHEDTGMTPQDLDAIVVFVRTLPIAQANLTHR